MFQHFVRCQNPRATSLRIGDCANSAVNCGCSSCCEWKDILHNFIRVERCTSKYKTLSDQQYLVFDRVEPPRYISTRASLTTSTASRDSCLYRTSWISTLHHHCLEPTSHQHFTTPFSLRAYSQISLASLREELNHGE